MKKLLIFVAYTLSSLLWAHPLDLGLLTLQTGSERVAYTLELNPNIVAQLLKLPADALTVSTVQSRAEALLRASLWREPLRSGDAQCALEATPEIKTEILPAAIRYQGSLHCPETQVLTWNFPFVIEKDMPATFQLMVRAAGNGQESLQIIEAKNTHWTLETGKSFSFKQFVQMGIEHIGVAPSEWHNENGWHLPEGIDHILFVVVLILCGGTVWQMIGMATGFTAGHSITLTAASLNWISIPSRIVESLIALSIAYLAIEAILQKTPRYRWAIAAAFGLVHGLGFATAIRELNLSGTLLIQALLGFNVGVELGQALIILLLFPLFHLLAKRPARYRQTQVSLGAMIGALGIFWFIQRAFF